MFGLSCTVFTGAKVVEMGQVHQSGGPYHIQLSDSTWKAYLVSHYSMMSYLNPGCLTLLSLSITELWSSLISFSWLMPTVSDL